MDGRIGTTLPGTYGCRLPLVDSQNRYFSLFYFLTIFSLPLLFEPQQLVDGGKRRNIAFTQYREEDALKDQGEKPQDDGSNPKVLVSNTQVKGQQFFFSACKSNNGANDSFMGYPSHKKVGGNDVYYGHVSAENSPKHCLVSVGICVCCEIELIGNQDQKEKKKDREKRNVGERMDEKGGATTYTVHKSDPFFPLSLFFYSDS